MRYQGRPWLWRDAGETQLFLKEKREWTKGFAAEPSPWVAHLWDGHGQFLL